MDIDLDALPDDASDGARALLEDARVQGWTLAATNGRRGWRVWCPSPDGVCRHQTWIDLNPTSPTYYSETRQRLQTTCWEEPA